MIPGTANPSAQLRGDTWTGFPSITISPGPGVALASAKMQLKDSAGIVQKEFSTTDNSITIADGGTGDWILAIPSAKLDIPAQDYQFDLQTTDANGAVRTYWRGILPLQQDVTT